MADVHERLTISQVISDEYLTQGNSEPGQFLEPLQLHFHEAIPLPRDVELAATSEDQWSRRQFSVLWAPMPSEYNTDDLTPVSVCSMSKDVMCECLPIRVIARNVRE